MPGGVPGHLHQGRQRPAVAGNRASVHHPTVAIDQANRAVDRDDHASADRGKSGRQSPGVGKRPAAGQAFDG